MKEEIFLSVKDDIIFRWFFGDEKNEETLVSFLKSVLRLPDDDFSEIEIVDPHLLRDYPKDKLGIIDIKLKSKSKKIIHIEVQLGIAPALKNRLHFYNAKLITEQIGRGDDYDVIKKVISIIITDEELIEGSPRYHHRFTMYDIEAKAEFSDLVEFHTVELNKLPQETDGTMLYDWAKFIDAESPDELDAVAERNPEVKKAVIKFIELTADERVRDTAFRMEMARRDAAAKQKWALKKQAHEIAEKMLNDNRPIEEIVKYTGLTIEEIETLRAKTDIAS